MSAYVFLDIEACRQARHHFALIGSDKTPMRKHLTCRDCSDNGPTAIVAYGDKDESKSFGQWRRPRQVEESQ